MPKLTRSNSNTDRASRRASSIFPIHKRQNSTPSLAPSSLFDSRKNSSEISFAGSSGTGVYTSDTPLPVDAAATVKKHVRRQASETPRQYLDRLRATVCKSELPAVLATSGDTFHTATLKIFLEQFDFNGDPIDIALRKLLMELYLPKETQQIDRIMEGFAKRYQECNTNLFPSHDQPYILAFSMMMLHTDAFNKSNKRKMTKDDFLKNTRIDGVPGEILDCIYDNIIFTPFIYVDDDTDINGQKIVQDHHGVNASTSSTQRSRSNSNRMDPYYLISRKQSHTLRANLDSIVSFVNPFSFTGTVSFFNSFDVHKAFKHAHILQIPPSSQESVLNPLSSSLNHSPSEGAYHLKVTKAGVLARKDELGGGAKRMTLGSRKWRSWGVILTGSQLLFFKDTSWVLVLKRQIEETDNSQGRRQVLFPRITQFKPDAMLSTKESIVLFDTSYDRYENCFRFVGPTGSEILFQADGKDELNDWISKINYAASFKTAGVKVRGSSSHKEERQPRRASAYTQGESGLRHEVAAARDVGDSEKSLEDTLPPDPSGYGRSDLIISKLEKLDSQIGTARSQLLADLRLGRNLAILAPFQKSSRDRIVIEAKRVAGRVRRVRIDLARMVCYREVLARDLVMEDWETRRRERKLRRRTEPPPIDLETSEVTQSDLESPIMGDKLQVVARSSSPAVERVIASERTYTRESTPDSMDTNAFIRAAFGTGSPAPSAGSSSPASMRSGLSLSDEQIASLKGVPTFTADPQPGQDEDSVAGSLVEGQLSPRSQLSSGPASPLYQQLSPTQEIPVESSKPQIQATPPSRPLPSPPVEAPEEWQRTRASRHGKRVSLAEVPDLEKLQELASSVTSSPSLKPQSRGRERSISPLPSIRSSSAKRMSLIMNGVDEDEEDSESDDAIFEDANENLELDSDSDAD